MSVGKQVFRLGIAFVVGFAVARGFWPSVAFGGFSVVAGVLNFDHELSARESSTGSQK